VEAWFVINIKPKKEFVVETLFQATRTRVYIPRLLKDGRPAPFFPGYGFIFFDFPSQFRLVRFMRGVKAVLGHGLQPIPVSPALVEEIQSRERDGFVRLTEVYDVAKVGDDVEIVDGPLKGMRGIFNKELKDRERVAILLRYVAYQAQVLIKRDKLRRVEH